MDSINASTLAIHGEHSVAFQESNMSFIAGLPRRTLLQSSSRRQSVGVPTMDRLTLGELETLTCFWLTIFFTLNLTAIAGQKLSLF